MKLLLDPEIYKWLISLKIIPFNPKHILSSSGKYEIDETTSKNFENGRIFSEIIKHIYSLENKPFPKTLDNLKEQSTPAARLYNWNVLYENMKHLGFALDPDLKSLLVSGDVQIINEFLKEIYESISLRLEKLSAASSVKSTANYELNLNKKDGLVKMNRNENLQSKI
jgi:CH-like domain in sperm protein